MRYAPWSQAIRRMVVSAGSRKFQHRTAPQHKLSNIYISDYFLSKLIISCSPFKDHIILDWFWPNWVTLLRYIFGQQFGRTNRFHNALWAEHWKNHPWCKWEETQVHLIWSQIENDEKLKRTCCNLCSLVENPVFNCNRHLQKAGLLNQELCKIEMFQLNFETLSYEANIIAQQWLNNVKHLQDFCCRPRIFFCKPSRKFKWTWYHK